MKTVRKAVGALLGGVTAAVVVTALGLFGVEIAPELAGAIAVILATAGTWIAPPNEVQAASDG